MSWGYWYGPDLGDLPKPREKQRDLAEWIEVKPRVWERRMREWPR
jgi:elongation factor P hydroxylase